MIMAAQLGEISDSYVTSMKATVFWIVAPCGLVDVYRRFGGYLCAMP